VLLRFVPKPDHELDRLSDEALIAYLRAAHAEGHGEAASRALAILVYGHWRNVERRVAMKVPPAEVEDITAQIMISAIRSAFDGQSVGEFAVWLATITQRRIADYFRRRPPTPALLTTADDDEPGSFEPAVPSEEGAVEVQDAIDRVLTRLGEDHRRVVELLVFEGRSAADAVAEVPGMTEANAHQIVSRFRRALRRQLEGDGDT
jgi:RNA polymerase sigma factor (sigma-70 family)